MRIAHIASEVAPWCQSGGLADVVGALPAAVDRASDGATESVVLAPLYRGARERAARAGADVADAGATRVLLGDRAVDGRWLRVAAPELSPVFLLDVPSLYDRDGGLYLDGYGGEYDDNALRFATLSRAASQDAARLLGGSVDVLHAHDWQAGLALVYLGADADRARAVFTIHNLAHQGNFAKDLMPELGLDWSLFTSEQLEFFDQLSMLKGGVAFADVVTTVSPGYAAEITGADLGFGLAGFLDGRVHGIVNGIDTSVWDPASDEHLPAHFRAGAPAGKAACRRSLIAELGLDVGDDTLLIGVVSRLVWQKGIDLIAAVAPRLADMGAALVVLGVGDDDLEQQLSAVAAAQPRRVAVHTAFDVPLSHRVYAGSDAVAVPSRFEPCGLTQMYAMRYGAVPIVRATGGLADTVDDPGDEALRRGEGTGIKFTDATAGDLVVALTRAVALFRDRDGWSRIVAAGMVRDSSWAVPARAYLDLYRSVVGPARSRHPPEPQAG